MDFPARASAICTGPSKLSCTSPLREAYQIIRKLRPIAYVEDERLLTLQMCVEEARATSGLRAAVLAPVVLGAGAFFRAAQEPRERKTHNMRLSSAECGGHLFRQPDFSNSRLHVHRDVARTSRPHCSRGPCREASPLSKAGLRLSGLSLRRVAAIMRTMCSTPSGPSQLTVCHDTSRSFCENSSHVWLSYRILRSAVHSKPGVKMSVPER